MKATTAASVIPALQEPLLMLSKHLRLARQARAWTMAEAAERCMVSLPTYKRMEAGDSRVAMGSWLIAWQRMEMLDAIIAATAPEKDRIGQALRDINGIKRVRKNDIKDDEYDF